MWNTGCNVVYNRTAKRLLYIVDGEDTSRTLLVPPDDESSFAGTIFPWADRDGQVPFLVLSHADLHIDVRRLEGSRVGLTVLVWGGTGPIRPA